MRKALILALIVLMGSVAFSQSNEFVFVTVYPYPDPTIIDSVMYSTSSDTVKSFYVTVDSLRVQTAIYLKPDSGTSATPFVGIQAGFRLITAGDTFYVNVNNGDSILTISDTLTNGDVSGSLTFEKFEAAFANTSVVDDWPVSGTYIPNGALATTVATDSYYVVINKRPTSSGMGNITFAKFDGGAAQYGSGDLVGIPFTFQVPYSPGLRFHGVEVLDSAANTANLDVVLYDAAVIAYGADNAAYAPGGASFDNVVGYGTVATFKAIGTNSSLGFVMDLEQPLRAPAGGWYYGVLVSRGTPTFAGNRSLILKLLFKR